MPLDFNKVLSEWRASLCAQIELAALISRNRIAHKWKVTYRSIVLRELVSWRVVDLLEQSVALMNQRHFLGAVILLRSAFETLGILIFLNHKTDAVVKGNESFFDLCDTTSRLMLGSKNQSTRLAAVNILTVLEKCEKIYPGILELYAHLSESAHPNYDGVCSGYSQIDENKYTTAFANRWAEKYENRLPDGLELCMSMFDNEYNNVWPETYGRLETWLVNKDEWLEENKPGI